MKKISEQVNKYAENIVKPIEIKSGFDELDKLTRGLRRSELTIIAARPSMGKAQPYTAKVLTPLGWKKMGDLKVFDVVFTAEGEITSVSGIFEQGIRPIYEVKMSDGSKTECDKSHLWEVSADHRCRKRKTILTTKEMIKNVKDGTRNRYAVERNKPIQFPTQEYELNEWLLGFYLGDGWSRGNVSLFINQEKILSKVMSLLPPNDMLSTLDGKHFRIKSIKLEYAGFGKKLPSQTKAILSKLKLVGLRSWEKFIPKQYLLGNVKQRRNLLQGLLDSDGYKVNKRWYEYSTTSKQLAEDVKFLVKSLGGYCSIGERIGKYKKNNETKICRKNYRVYLTLTSSKRQKHYIESIKFIGHKKARCITIYDPSQLYITDDFIVTHNSALMLDIAKVTSLSVPTAIFSLEMVEEQLIDRMFAAEQKVKLYDLQDGNVKLSEETIQKVSSYNLSIDDSSKINTKYIWDILEAEHFDVVFVDYLNLFSDAKTLMARHREIGETTKQLRSIARTKNIAVVALCQLNRNLEQRQDKRPRLSDLRESGELEQIADNIILLYRPSYYKIFDEGDVDAEDDWEAELIVAKNRNGPVGKVQAVFRPHLMSFAPPNWQLDKEF